MTSLADSPIFKGKSFTAKRVSSPNVNSWDQTLGAGASLTGRAEEVTLYPAVSVAVLTDGTGSLFIEQSTDGVNWDDSETVTIAASTNSVSVRLLTRRFYRTRFTSTSGSAHTFFRLQTMFGQFNPGAGSTGEGSEGTALRSSVILGNAGPTTVSDNTLITLLTITPVVDTFVTKIVCSGDIYAKFTLTIAATDRFFRRSGPDRDVVWDFKSSPLKLALGSPLDIKVFHCWDDGGTYDFETTVLGYT